MKRKKVKEISLEKYLKELNDCHIDDFEEEPE